MKEPEVLLKTHAYVKSHGLSQHSIVRLFTDAHSTLIGNRLLEPFQRFFVQVGDVLVHPDLVGQWDDGETVFAIEAKGDDDLLKGIAQAEMYKLAFHHAFLAADARALATGWVEIARRRGIGVIAVSDTVQVLHTPDVYMPLRDPFQLIRRQMDSAVLVSRGQTFLYNLPTHYLVWAIVLQPNESYAKADLPDLIQGYPMPEHPSLLRPTRSAPPSL